MDESAAHDMHDRDRIAARPMNDLPAVAPAVAAMTLAAAGLTLAAGIWLWRASRRSPDDRRANFPAPAIHRRP